MISLIIAGGISVAATSQTATEWPDINNHTLRGEAIPASQVVCRNLWGTPMLPDGKGGYSLIAPINQDFIRQSLIIPPRNSDMVAYRPLPPMEEAAPAPALPAETTTAAPEAPAAPPAPAAESAPAEAAPAGAAAPTAPEDPFSAPAAN